jgi:hypothetical protein
MSHLPFRKSSGKEAEWLWRRPAKPLGFPA